ncbi:DUF397 domain-containing protein [Nonomuraea sp. NPDC050556]|uniref:DUF397 domain-containing protein n=1 Tax=Nonomuraea sp. NPDC050556 TaxID=3364369 RepID=UPI003798AC9F
MDHAARRQIEYLISNGPQWLRSAAMQTSPVWRKSSYSTEQEFGTCVEVAQLGANLGVRDSKDPDGPHLTFSPASWVAFVSSIKSHSI